MHGASEALAVAAMTPKNWGTAAGDSANACTAVALCRAPAGRRRTVSYPKDIEP